MNKTTVPPFSMEGGIKKQTRRLNDMNYVWKDLCPLTCKEAHVAFAKGVSIICLGPKKSVWMKSKEDITRHAKKGGIFAANRDVLAKAETHYVVTYTISRKVPDKGQGYRLRDPEQVEVMKKYKSDLEASDDCKRFLSEIMQQHGLCEDGTYWVTCEKHRYVFDVLECMTEFDEGEVAVKNGQVEQIPCDFWLPF
jgi:hypothetical protein